MAGMLLFSVNDFKTRMFQALCVTFFPVEYRSQKYALRINVVYQFEVDRRSP